MTRARGAEATGARRGERGSALLIVFVFAAVIAIMLYREMPIAAFEARRTKEELLISRGHEYQRAVQLYYRRFRGQYPASIEQLENTNSIRFLRHKYKDPFTGKDDWRLLHAGGPNGQLIDSKVTPPPQTGATNGQTGQNGASGFGTQSSGFGSNSSTSSFGSTSTTGFGSTSTTGFGPNATSGFGSNGTSGFRPGTSNTASSFNNSSSSGSFGSTSDSGTTTEVPTVPKRAPVVDANGTSPTGQTPTSAELNQDPSIPLLPASNMSDRSAAGPPGVAPIGAPIQQSIADGTQQQGAGTGQPITAGFNPTQAATGTPAGTTTNGIQSGSTSTSSSTGRLFSGGLAGVASRAKGESIKKVNDQIDYSLWEFWYDPTKDTSAGNGTNQRNGAGGQNMPNGTRLGQPATGNGFGTTTTPTTPGVPTSPDPNNPFQRTLPPPSTTGDTPQQTPMQPSLGIRPLQNQQQQQLQPQSEPQPQPENPPNDTEPAPTDGGNTVPNPPQPPSIAIPRG